MPARIVTRGVILRALDGSMRKFKKFWPVRSRTFRSLLVVAGALLLMTALAPKANADVLVYFNFEDAVLGGVPDFTSDVIPANGGDNPGGGLVLTTITTTATVFAATDGFLENRTALDSDTADPGLAVGFRTTPVDNGSYIQFAFDATFFANMSLSFAVDTAGNGFNNAQLFYSTTGPGGPFTAAGSSFISTAGVQIITLTVPSAVDNQAGAVLRLVFTGGTSNGQNLQTIIDNIQVNGSIVPEPATLGGGLLGVLGLFWHQRRRIRLILPRCSFRRLRRA
jgi:hypothetical protein